MDTGGPQHDVHPPDCAQFTGDSLFHMTCGCGFFCCCCFLLPLFCSAPTNEARVGSSVRESNMSSCSSLFCWLMAIQQDYIGLHCIISGTVLTDRGCSCASAHCKVYRGAGWRIFLCDKQVEVSTPLPRWRIPHWQLGENNTACHPSLPPCLPFHLGFTHSPQLHIWASWLCASVLYCASRKTQREATPYLL